MNRKDRRAQEKQNKQQANAAPKKSGAAALVTPEALETAQTLFDNGFYYEAEELFETLSQLDPEHMALLRAYAKVLYVNEHIEKAHGIFEKIQSINPEDEVALIGLASCALYAADKEQAMRYLKRLDGRKLAHNDLNQISSIYAGLGKLDEARARLEDSLKMYPHQIGAYYELTSMKKFAAGDKDIAKVEHLAAQAETLRVHDRIMVDFTLGKIYLDINETEKGFARYTSANARRKSLFSGGEVDAVERYVDSAIALFTPEFAAKFKNAGTVTSDRPVFVVGMPRSGSTLVNQILSAHPQVASFGEKAFFPQCVPAVANAEIAGLGISRITGKPISPTITRPLLDAITPDALDIMGNNYLSKTDPYAANGERRIVDKMLFNHMWVGLIRLTLPQAKIIHCLRDPVDIGFSIWKLWFSDNLPWAYDLKDIGRYYNAYKKIMDHWHALFPNEILQVRYEDMVNDQEGQTRRLLDFANLPWDDKVLKFYENERGVVTASAVQVRQPIYKDSVKKWKKFETYLAPLIDEVAKSGLY